MDSFDVVVIGAGAAGLFCAGVAGQRGLKVLLLDHGERIAEAGLASPAVIVVGDVLRGLAAAEVPVDADKFGT